MIGTRMYSPSKTALIQGLCAQLEDTLPPRLQTRRPYLPWTTALSALWEPTEVRELEIAQAILNLGRKVSGFRVSLVTFKVLATA